MLVTLSVWNINQTAESIYYYYGIITWNLFNNRSIVVRFHSQISEYSKFFILMQREREGDYNCLRSCLTSLLMQFIHFWWETREKERKRKVPRTQSATLSRECARSSSTTIRVEVKKLFYRHWFEMHTSRIHA